MTATCPSDHQHNSTGGSGELCEKEFLKIPEFRYILGAPQHFKLPLHVLTRPRPKPALSTCSKLRLLGSLSERQDVRRKTGASFSCGIVKSGVSDGLRVSMRVMHVGHVGVLVSHTLMPVLVCVWLAGRIVGAVGMLVMRVVDVSVRVLHLLVIMLVLVMLGEVQPDADAHQQSGRRKL